jgi:hypothetical protein
MATAKAAPAEKPVGAVGPAPRNPTPSNYGTGSVKRDPASLAVAVRTNIPDPDSAHDWGVMTVDRGGHYSPWDDVASWDDLLVLP